MEIIVKEEGTPYVIALVGRLDTNTAPQLEEELSAFEIAADQRELAAKNEAGYAVLDAGRGNPNWINTQSRYAFTRFMNYALEESALDF